MSSAPGSAISAPQLPCRKKFGLSAFSDKYLFVAPEIKSDLQVEQAEFQSMVSGEDIQVNTKYAKARSCVWTVPGVLAGNEVS